MTANRGPKRANRRRAAATGETYTQARQARLTPPADDHPRKCQGCGWILPASEQPRPCPNGCDDWFDRKREESDARRWATAANRRYQEAPVPADVFLDHIRAQADLMPVAPNMFTGEDIATRLDWGLPCLRCGQPAANAYITVPLTSMVPRWLDLCHACADATRVYDPTRDTVTTYGPQS